MANCCLKPRGDLQPLSSSKNSSHDRCYAKAIGNCSSEISREHWISENLMRVVGPEGFLIFHGLPWRPDGEPQKLSFSSAQSKVLCTIHNSALSPLDDLAGRFFAAFPSVAARKKPNQRLHLFVGTDLERWMLKVLCGGFFARVLRFRDGTSIDWEPPKAWLDFIFHGTPLCAPAGLYLCQKVGDNIDPSTHVSVAALVREGELYGLSIGLHGFRWILTMSPPSIPHPEASLLANASYRPNALIINERIGQTVFLFDWGPNHNGGEFNISWQ